MNLLVLGATGKTGRLVVAQALEAGHKVTAFVRTAGKLSPRSGLTVIVGDAENPEQLQAAAKGQDAVISALGHTSAARSSAQSIATSSLISVLPPNTKFITLTGFGVPDPKDPKIPLSGRLINRLIELMPGQMYNDGLRHVQLLRGSHLDWTAIRAPRLTLGAATGHGEIGYFSLSGTATVPRADVAAAMLECLTSATWSKQAPMIRLRPHS